MQGDGVVRTPTPVQVRNFRSKKSCFQRILPSGSWGPRGRSWQVPAFREGAAPSSPCIGSRRNGRRCPSCRCWALSLSLSWSLHRWKRRQRGKCHDQFSVEIDGRTRRAASAGVWFTSAATMGLSSENEHVGEEYRASTGGAEPSRIVIVLKTGFAFFQPEMSHLVLVWEA